MDQPRAMGEHPDPPIPGRAPIGTFASWTTWVPLLWDAVRGAESISSWPAGCELLPPELGEHPTGWEGMSCRMG